MHALTCEAETFGDGPRNYVGERAGNLKNLGILESSISTGRLTLRDRRYGRGEEEREKCVRSGDDEERTRINSQPSQMPDGIHLRIQPSSCGLVCGESAIAGRELKAFLRKTCRL